MAFRADNPDGELGLLQEGAHLDHIVVLEERQETDLRLAVDALEQVLRACMCVCVSVLECIFLSTLCTAIQKGCRRTNAKSLSV